MDILIYPADDHKLTVGTIKTADGTGSMTNVIIVDIVTAMV